LPVAAWICAVKLSGVLAVEASVREFYDFYGV